MSSIGTGRSSTASVVPRTAMTYRWTLSGGTITATGEQGSSIQYVAGPVGTLTIGCTEINAAGLSSSPGTRTVTVGLACGAAGALCKPAVNELVASPIDYGLVWAPAVALDPQDRPMLAYPEIGASTMTVARRDAANSWTRIPTPFYQGQLALAVAPDGSTYGFGWTTLTPDGSGVALSPLSLRKYDSGAWTEVTSVSGTAVPYTLGAGADGIFASFSMISQDGILGSYAAGVSGSLSLGTVLSPFPLALSPAGHPHVAFWATAQDGTNSLSWSASGQTPSAVPQAPSAGPVTWSRTSIALAVTTGADGADQPHVLFETPLLPQYLEGCTSDCYVRASLTYATRVAGAWQVATVARASVSGDCPSSPPTEPGQSCHETYTSFRPLSVLTGPSGQVRFLYEREQQSGTWSSLCFQPGTCVWQQDAVPNRSLVLGWSDGSSYDSTVLLEDAGASLGAAAVDSKGRIDVALWGSSMRFLQFTPL